MKTIGQLLREAREAKNYSLIRLENITKIKIDFLQAIEKEDWNKLPAFPTILGFVKNIASVLGIDERVAAATLRRDYPPKKLHINPKPDVSNKFIWSPKLTFAIGIGIVIIVFFGYLIFQYSRFISPPRLTVDSPKQDQVVSGNNVLVFGTTDIDAKVTVNNQPVLTDENGKFSVSIEVVPETKEIVITATSRSGKMTEVKRQLQVISE
ncbi:MAG TPA: helix-turn-helix domain-containing protein [Alphaproteobacteria bacterium]|jgi:cytoskeletal protein RodZ|nr:helix-turn-helix domain-containing protein [Alphaproteobacteria bacterium]